MQTNLDYINFSTTSLELCQNFYKSISSKALSIREMDERFEFHYSSRNYRTVKYLYTMKECYK